MEGVQTAHKVPGEEFRALKFGLVEVVYEWAKGMVSVWIFGLVDPTGGISIDNLRLALRTDYGTYGCCGRYHCTLYY